MSFYKTHPNAKIGSPGPLQGYNTGVVIYNLAKMRQNNIYNNYLKPKSMLLVQQKYGFTYTLAEQDLFTLIGWEQPHLFYNLPCTFNKQVSIQYLTPPTDTLFPRYHACAPLSRVHILHLNGCGPAPKFCPGYSGPTQYSRNNFVVYDVLLNMEMLWNMFAYSDMELFEEMLDIWKY